MLSHVTHQQAILIVGLKGQVDQLNRENNIGTFRRAQLVASKLSTACSAHIV